MNKKPLSIRQLWRSKKIYWVDTYKTIIRYVSKDYADIFKPIVIGSRTGKRYFVKEENIQRFIKKFENSELSE